jgi:NADPH:quinone reductase-like Zn-dependent oxidoreductase
VFGIGKGTYAEYAPTREDKLAHKPANLTFEQAAAVAISGLTALQGLRDHGKVRPGQKVLIIGASGRRRDLTGPRSRQGRHRLTRGRPPRLQRL